MRVQDQELQVVRQIVTQRTMCVNVESAVLMLSRGETVTVADSSIAELRRRVDLAIGGE